MTYNSHYDYLDAHLDQFFAGVFGERNVPNAIGMVSAHGDKGYGYKQTWEKAGIPFNRGMLMFFLTFTELMDRPQHESDEWVIENYDEYLPLIERIEADVAEETDS